MTRSLLRSNLSAAGFRLDKNVNAVMRAACSAPWSGTTWCGGSLIVRIW